MQTQDSLSTNIPASLPIIPSDPPANDSEFLDRLGIDVLCLLHNPRGHGKIIMRRVDDGRLYAWQIWRLESEASFCLLVGDRAESCVSNYGRRPNTWNIKRSRWAMLRTAIRRIWDEHELRKSGLLTDEEMQRLGIADANEGWL